MSWIKRTFHLAASHSCSPSTPSSPTSNNNNSSNHFLHDQCTNTIAFPRYYPDTQLKSTLLIESTTKDSPSSRSAHQPTYPCQLNASLHLHHALAARDPRGDIIYSRIECIRWKLFQGNHLIDPSGQEIPLERETCSRKVVEGSYRPKHAETRLEKEQFRSDDPEVVINFPIDITQMIDARSRISEDGARQQGRRSRHESESGAGALLLSLVLEFDTVEEIYDARSFSKIDVRNNGHKYGAVYNLFLSSSSELDDGGGYIVCMADNQLPAYSPEDFSRLPAYE